VTRTYRIKVGGEDAKGQTWEIEDVVHCEFQELWHMTASRVFNRLTEGKAEFGRPGTGCKGPYRITDIEMHLEPNVVTLSAG
jgi:hypothetical protein